MFEESSRGSVPAVIFETVGAGEQNSGRLRLARIPGCDVYLLLGAEHGKPGERVRGSWEHGHFAPEFTNSHEVVPAAVRALNAWRSQTPDADAG